VNPLDELSKLTSLFPSTPPVIERAEHAPQSGVPEPYKSLLAHNSHMTVTMEEFHHCTVNVVVLDSLLDGDMYYRKILLRKADSGRCVQFGLVRFNFAYVTKGVRDEIIAQQLPLGRILINHNVLRHIDLGAILRIVPGPEMQQYFECPPNSVTYGRLATIFCNQQPAVDLLEVSTPLP